MQNWIPWFKQHGTPFEQAQVAFLIDAIPPERPLLQEILQHQGPSGGFAGFWTQGKPALDPTCHQLNRLHSVGAAGLPEARQAVQFLLRNFTTESTACELEGLLPPWLPDQPASFLYLRANSLFQVAASGTGVPEVALQPLLDNLSNLGFLQTHWLTAGLFHLLGRKSTFAELMQHLQALLPDLDTEALVWLSDTLLVSGIPADHLLLQQAASRLQQKRTAAGIWTGEEGSEATVTVQALGVLKRVQPALL